MKRLDEILHENANLISRANSQTSSNEEPAKVCPICQGVGFFRKDVPVGHPDFGRAFPCPHKLAEVAAAQLNELRASSGMSTLAHMTFETFLPKGLGLSPDKQQNLNEAYEKARYFANDPKGWLVLKGGYGAGKTHLAAAIANQRLAQGLPALFIVVPDLLDYLRATYAPNSAVTYDERFESLRTSPLLILDDFGSHMATPWAQEKLFQLLNYRYNSPLPTVITTNVEIEEIDPRLRSRMADDAICKIVEIQAPDFRRISESRNDSDLSTLAMHADQRFENFDLRANELSREERAALQDAVNLCRHYAEAPEGWLALTGEYGSGKTHLAAAVANYRKDQGDEALFIVVPDLLDHLRSTFSPNSPVSYDRRFEEIRSAPFLVLDDLGTESATPWAKEKLFQIINYRYVARLPTVFTMQNIDEIEPRLRSRMHDLTRCSIVANFAPSYRGSPTPPPPSDNKRNRGRR